VGRPPCTAWDGLAAAPQLRLIEASAAEAHVSTIGGFVLGGKYANGHARYGIA